MLTVYRASAGAGKTYRLTGDYLILLFSHPTAYRRILAVTFTNKATDEMKTRIIEALYNLATGTSNDYISDLKSACSLNEKQIRAKARDILVSILHDYSSFNISTIDKFFQQTMRAFTREIGLQGGYAIEMDQDMVLTETIDRMMADLEKPESKELLGWLLRFAEDKVENGGEWNLHKDIKILSKELFKESYKAYTDELKKDITNKEVLDKYKEELFAIIRSTESEAKRLGEWGLSLLAKYGLEPSAFKGGQRSALYFLEKLVKGEMKPPTKTFVGFVDNLEACFTKTIPQSVRHIISCVYEEGLNDCIRAIVALFENLTAYNTAREIIRYYYTLGILSDVSRLLATYREENNIMLIADTTELLNKVIEGSDTPFIYEKTGTTIDHYMIDEFQDTSRMQWENFRPLVVESLAHKQANLIVGDVKQSIYRFRNSDWKLLEEQIKYDFTKEQLHEETLTENWRSCRHIVEFNNALFVATPLLLQNMFNEAVDFSALDEEKADELRHKILSAYTRSSQFVAPPFRERPGHVRIEFFERKTDERDWKEEALERLPALLEQLQDNGYQLQDIAILTRTNKEGASVAETLLAYKEAHPSDTYRYDIISDEALIVGSSPAVRLLVLFMRYLQKPDDKTTEAMASISCKVLTGEPVTEEKTFPPELKNELDALSHLSLYEITEGLYRLFAPWFTIPDQAFIQAFMDTVSEYSKKESADLTRFLKWWGESGSGKAISTPDARDAVRILTVHKSKGLGFKVVIMPFGDWEIDHRSSSQVILWCKPQESPFNHLPLVPVRYNSQLAQTIFAEDYFNEKLHAYIDSLNTLYVAFTRVKEEMIILAPRPKKLTEDTLDVEKIASVADLLWAGLSQPSSQLSEEDIYIDLIDYFDKEEGVFELGEWYRPKLKKDTDSGEEQIVELLASVAPDDRLRLRLRGKELLFDDVHRKQGILLHEVMSKIRTAADINVSVERYRLAGAITQTEATQLCDRLHELTRREAVTEWFDGSMQVLNEVELLTGKNVPVRPDRVMISTDRKVTVVDYKFGQKEAKRYQAQMKKYIRLIRQMGYKTVEGFLWYVELDKIEEVIL